MAIQPILETIQTWLNKTYTGKGGYNPIAVTGEPGWDTTNAMLIAYQIENGISESVINDETSKGIYDFTDEGFVPISSETDFSNQSNLNRLYILQGAFYVKGINPGGFKVPYRSSFSEAVSLLQSNAGISSTGIVDILVAKALLSMDDFVVLSQYGGTQEIAQIQKALNGRYAEDMGALIPADGVYGRELNKALIYAFQRTEGISVVDANEADGHFGPGTQADAPTLVPGDANGFVTILQYALYCNGYTGVSFTGIYDSATQSAVASFGKAMGISTDEGSEVDLDVWMGLLLSSGNPNRGVSGCDAAQALSLEDAQTLKANGYDIVGRYLTGNFQTSVAELTNILNAGLNVFPIYETGSYETSYFSGAQGTSDAASAVQAARAFGIPQETTIYFTVDYDMEGGQIQNLVLPYFEAIKNKFKDAQLNYNIGVYGSRNVCKEVIEAGYAELAFVDGASTGYSGNMGYPMPVGWAFNQIKEGVTIDGIQIDNDQVSGLDNGFSSISPSGESIISNMSGNTINQLPDTGLSNHNVDIDIYNTLENFLTNIINIKGPDILEFFDVDKEKFFLKGGPFYFADNNAYFKYDSGIKPILGTGGDLNLYFNVDGFTLDVLKSGIGSNLNPDILFDNNSELKDKILSLMPTGTSGNAQFYSVWNGNQDAEPGYIEFGMEYGISIPAIENKELNEDGKLETHKSLAGDYVFIDLIIGLRKDLLEKEFELALNISEEFALKLFLDLTTDLLKAGDKSIEIVDDTLSIILDEVPKLIELIAVGTIVGVGVLVILGIPLLGVVG